jgi:hypothetical protein
MVSEHMSASIESNLARARGWRLAAAFALLGGPLAWSTQLWVGYALASWPCFPRDERYLQPPREFAWTGAALIGLVVACALIALAAWCISWRNLRLARAELASDRSALVYESASRRCFGALWGVLLGGGFFVATLFTAVALLLLPRCAG